MIVASLASGHSLISIPGQTSEQVTSQVLLAGAQVFFFLRDVKFSPRLTTSGNVIRGNQNYANEILKGTSGHELVH